MLQKMLDKGDVVAIVLVNLSGVVLPETVSRDAAVPKIIADSGELHLDGSDGDWEDSLLSGDMVIQAINTDVVVEDYWNSKGSGLACFLFDNVQSITSTVCDDVAEPEIEDVGDPEPKVRLQN